MTKSDVCFIYVTASGKDEAKTLGRGLVEKRLAACVNIIDNMDAIYRWQEQIEEAKESIMIIKTINDNICPVNHYINQYHSYSCACVAVLPIVDGSKPYLDWIINNTSVNRS